MWQGKTLSTALPPTVPALVWTLFQNPGLPDCPSVTRARAALMTAREEKPIIETSHVTFSYDAPAEEAPRIMRGRRGCTARDVLQRQTEEARGAASIGAGEFVGSGIVDLTKEMVRRKLRDRLRAGDTLFLFRTRDQNWVPRQSSPSSGRHLSRTAGLLVLCCWVPSVMPSSWSRSSCLTCHWL